MTITRLSDAERQACVDTTRGVYDKWAKEISPDLVKTAEESVANRKKLTSVGAASALPRASPGDLLLKWAVLDVRPPQPSTGERLPWPPSPGHDDVTETVREVDHPVVSGRIEEFIAALAMAGICVISFGDVVNVVVHYVTNASFAATEELSIFLLVVMTIVGASLPFIRGENIRITAILDCLLLRRPRMGLIMVIHLLTVIMFALVSWYSGLLTLDEMEFGRNLADPRLSELALHHLAAAGFGRDHSVRHRPRHPPGMAGLPNQRDGCRHRHRRRCAAG